MKTNCDKLKPSISRESFHEASDDWCVMVVEVVLGYGCGDDPWISDRHKFRKDLKDFVANWKPTEVAK